MSTTEPGQQSTGRANRRHGYRSMFWPIVFIGVGVILLLGEMGTVQALNWWALVRLWPVLLILAGLDLLFARTAPVVGAVLGLVVVAGLVALLIWGGQAGWLSGEPLQIRGITILETADIQHDIYTAPLGQQESAVVELNFGAFRTTVGALSDSNNLIEADIDHVGTVQFEANGDKTARVVLDETANVGSFSWSIGADKHLWDIRLTPRIPLDLVVDASSGRAELELDELDLESLTLDASSGALSASLPATVSAVQFDGSSGHTELTLADETEADVWIEMSSGALDISVGQDARLAVTVRKGSSGRLTLSLPQGTPVRVEVNDSGSGSVRLPAEIKLVESGDQDEGIWQTDDWKEGNPGLTLTVEDRGSGNITIEYR